MDLKRQQFSITFAGKPLVIETSRLAEQATAAVIGRYGDTAVLVTATMGARDRDVGYFPLIVDYEERFYAAGKILGSRFIRREGRASEEAVLSGRLIDRTIRPLFDHRIRRDVQIIITILSFDEENDPDFIALLATSTALAISEIPWGGPVAGVKVAQLTGQNDPVVNPLFSEIEKGFDSIAFLGGTAETISMIELEGREIQETTVALICTKAQEVITELIRFQEKIVRAVGAPKITVPLSEHPDLRKHIVSFLKDKLEDAIYAPDKASRTERLEVLTSDLEARLVELNLSPKERGLTEHYLDEAIDELVHHKVLTAGKRPDGRALDEVRELHAEVGLFPRNHGSAVFIRGNTQALAVTTLGGPSAEQLVETIEFSGKRRFLLHYNFPPYSVGEIAPLRGPGRREIGHGALALKALRNLIPDQNQFPYTIRVVSEILSSNGSSSMATVCSASLSLMDAGVPIVRPAAGIAIGMMSDEAGNYKILTDIQGPEDHYGDMDFKVAGTTAGVTAIQMDVKIRGISIAMIREALAAGKKARLHILETMAKTLAAPRPELSTYAPIILTLPVPTDRIGEIIGPGGRVINGIIAKTGVITIDIEQEGRVLITAHNREKAEMALAEVRSIIKEYAVGEIVEGTVVKILEFGAIVQIDPNHDGMIHVSELKEGYVKRVEEVLKLGDFVRAKIVRAEPGGRIALSLKNVSQ